MYEDEVKKRIKKRLQEAKYYYLYCCSCGRYLCCTSSFQKFIVCWGCRNEPVKYQNSENNLPPKPSILH